MILTTTTLSKISTTMFFILNFITTLYFTNIFNYKPTTTLHFVVLTKQSVLPFNQKLRQLRFAIAIKFKAWLWIIVLSKSTMWAAHTELCPKVVNRTTFVQCVQLWFELILVHLHPLFTPTSVCMFDGHLYAVIFPVCSEKGFGQLEFLLGYQNRHNGRLAEFFVMSTCRAVWLQLYCTFEYVSSTNEILTELKA